MLNRIFAGLADRAGEPERLMIDAPHLEAHRTAASLIKRGCSRCLGRSKGGLNSKLHAVCEGQGRPVVLLLSEGQISDHRGAALMLPNLPQAKELPGHKGYDSSRVRHALAERGIAPCTPSSKSRKIPIPYDKVLLSAAPPHREHVRPPQALAPHRHALRSMRPHLHVRHLPRNHRPLLDR